MSRRKEIIKKAFKIDTITKLNLAQELVKEKMKIIFREKK